jgi:hypothetical protein
MLWPARAYTLYSVQRKICMKRDVNLKKGPYNVFSGIYP